MSRSLTLLIALAVVLISFTLQVTALSTKTIQTIVKEHNKVRAMHHAPPLKWDKSLAKYAQNWSNKCGTKYSKGPYGENMAMGFPNWSSAVNGWYKEVRFYSFDESRYCTATSHFTQVVWKSTTKIGCGSKTCNGSKIYTCSYSSKGNVLGPNSFADNVNKI